MKNVLGFEQADLAAIATVGGKNASIGEMIQHLAKAGIKIPGGFAITANTYRNFLKQNQLDSRIADSLASLDVNDVKRLKQTSAQIRGWILEMPFAAALSTEITTAYAQLSKNTVAVRSSATAEDLPEASFAGQQETFLNVTGIDNVLAAIKRVYASLFTDRAISYRAHHGIDHQIVAMSVGVQWMVRSDKGASGVMFTMDTESGFDQVVLINAAYGLGELIVQGSVNPDEFYVFKPTLKAGKSAILRRTLGEKAKKMVYQTADNRADPGINPVMTVPVPEWERLRFCLNDDDVHELARQALLIEEHYQRPMDIEWAKDGMDGELYILQARPETVKSQEQRQFLERYQLTETGGLKVTGRSVGQKIGQGNARVIIDPKEMHNMQTGEVLVTEMTDPDWEPVMKRAAAIVTDRGGRTCHAAIVARELGIPAVVGCRNATITLKTGEPITVSCAEGDEGHVYAGLLTYKLDKTPVKDMPKLPLKLCINLGSPEKAFSYQFLPNDGVGLARLEFIINDLIGIHPNAALQFDTLSAEVQEKIRQKTTAYASPVEYYVQKLSEGVATIAAAFYPKEVIFRFSDFKSNEYANLLGGQQFEPKEENPMIGFRGAARYVAASFRACFALECEAFKRVRENMGLTNAVVMIPFVRTVDELKAVVALCESFGLKRGVNALKIYMMCEIPSNPLLADEFLQHVDGFSIGSNDLTQLTLGLDRDSDLVAPIFDERNAAVKALLHQAITACNKANKYVGICGQGPSDHPDLAQWLMQEGIQSMSLNPDTIIETWLMLAKVK